MMLRKLDPDLIRVPKSEWVEDVNLQNSRKNTGRGC